MHRPHSFGFHHVAIFCKKFEETIDFYTKILGMEVIWHPDVDTIYLSFGSDNISLRRAKNEIDFTQNQSLDHIGMLVLSKEEVNSWYTYLQKNNTMSQNLNPPKLHRDDSYSFYCMDPDRRLVQILYNKSLAERLK